MRSWIVAVVVAVVGAAAAAVGAVAFADAAADVTGRVVGPSKQGVKDANVVVRVKAWPGGKFKITDHDARTDAKGRVSLPGVIPKDTRYGVWLATVAPGWTLTSHYHWSGKPEPMPPADLVVAPAHPLRLRFVDDTGKPVDGVRAYPSMRAAADGTRHGVATGARDSIVVTSERDGTMDMKYFLPGEWAGVEVAFPGRDFETRHFVVPAAKNAVVDVPAKAPVTPDRELTAGGDAQKRFFLTGPKAGDAEPADGFGLVLVLPGGDGSAEFRDWIRERYEPWVDASWVWAGLVAPKWSASQEIIWPGAASKVEDMKFTTEDFVAAVVEECAKTVKIDRRRVVAVGWSSSGPALWRMAARKETPVTGFLIAMSVFHPDELDSLANAKGRPVFLLHSPEDDRCPLRLAEQGRDALKKAGAKVGWATYEGGHGWAGESEDHARRAPLDRGGPPIGAARPIV